MENSDFLKEIAEQVKLGYGFVPFIGAGLSQASGIITAQRFDALLAHTLRLCCDQNHDLSRLGWPDQPSPQEVKLAHSWVEDQFKALHHVFVAERDRREKFGGAPKLPYLQDKTEGWLRENTAIIQSLKAEFRGIDWSLKEKLSVLATAMNWKELVHKATWSTTLERDFMGVISLHDWRATLTFLASLHYQDEVERNLLTCQLKPFIIDRFNTHITRGRRRNLAHSMLCHLAGRMRIRIILTTNFDTLIEDAFVESGEPIRTLRVSTQGTLPDASTVHGLNCCIKLHGELHETRADYSLDEYPPPEDLDTFYQYLVGGPRGADGASFVPSHVIVCGYSGSDHRCVRMIEYALSKDKNIRVFWIFHTRSSMAAFLKNSRLASPEFSNRVHVTWTDRTDLLLYELYQRITLSLPRGGFNYQLNHNYPPEPVVGTTSNGTSRDADPSSHMLPLPAAASIRVVGAYGALERMKALFNSAIEKKKECIWLELEDYADVYGLAHELFQIVSLRSGNYEIERTTFIPSQSRDGVSPQPKDWNIRISRVMQAWQLNSADHIIFLYGRNGPGGCKGWEDDWDTQAHYWTATEYDGLVSFMDGLVECGFQVIYAPYDKDRAQGGKEMFGKLTDIESSRDRVRPLPLFTPEDEPWVFPTTTTHDCDPKNAKIEWVCDKVTEWPEKIMDLCLHLRGLHVSCQNDDASPKNSVATRAEIQLNWLKGFLFKASLIRQSRHPASLISEAVIPCPFRYNAQFIDNDVFRDELASTWLGSRWLRPLLREKRGGYIWVYRDTRLALRLLALGRFEASVTTKAALKSYQEKVSRAHFGIAGWYHAAFCSTGHAEPLVEALYHYWQTALHAFQLDTSVENTFPTSQQIDAEKEVKPVAARTNWNDRRGWRLFRTSLSCLIKALRLGRSVLAFWSDEREAAASFDFTRGRAQESLKQLVDTLQKVAGNEPTRLEEGMSLIQMLQAECRRHIRPFSTLSDDSTNATEWIYTTECAILPGASSAEPPSDNPSTSKTDVAPTNAIDLAKLFKSWKEDVKAWETYMKAWSLENDDEWLKTWLSCGILNDNIVSAALTIFFEVKSSGDTETAEKLNQHQRDLVHTLQTTLENRCDPFSAPQLIELIFEMTYSLVRRAKLLERISINSEFEIDASPHAPADIENCELRTRVDVNRLSPVWQNDAQGFKNAWLKVCALCRTLLDLCQAVHPNLWEHDFLMRIKVLRTYGLALGRLGRFHEARRRLNEAHAICTRLAPKEASRDFGILSLRCAEVDLLEARFISDLNKLHHTRQREAEKKNKKVSLTPPAAKVESTTIPNNDAEIQTLVVRYGLHSATPADVQRLCTAKVDDAWLHLEHADQKLRGHSQSPHWWGRLAALQFRAYIEAFAFAALPLEIAGRSSGDWRGQSNYHYRSLAFRHPRDPRALLESHFRRSENCLSDRTYSMLRSIHFLKVACYYAFTIRGRKPEFSDSFKELYGSVVKDLQKAYEPTPTHSTTHSHTYYQHLKKAEFFKL